MATPHDHSGHEDRAAVHEEAERRLGSIQARYTPRRRMLVDVFVDTSRPLTLPEVIAANDGLAQSSVYRNLAALELAGVVRRIVTADDFARFELSEAVSGHHHHHLICTDCGSIQDVTLPSVVEATLAKEFAAISDDRNFEVAAHQIDLVGRCQDCHT